MRILLFIFLLAGTVVTAILWNRQLAFQVEPARSGPAEEEPPPTDEVQVVVGLPPGTPLPPRRPAAPRPGRSSRRPAGGEESPEEGPPGSGRPPRSAESRPVPAPVPPVERWATLAEGETVYGLARRLLGRGARYREILELNGLTEEEARNLPTGRRLRLPPR